MTSKKGFLSPSMVRAGSRCRTSPALPGGLSPSRGMWPTVSRKGRMGSSTISGWGPDTTTWTSTPPSQRSQRPGSIPGTTPKTPAPNFASAPRRSPRLPHQAGVFFHPLFHPPFTASGSSGVCYSKRGYRRKTRLFQPSDGVRASPVVILVREPFTDEASSSFSSTG
jgi:hypothetical protein